MRIYYAAVVCLLLVMIGCREQSNTPKPRAYPRINYPERAYAVYDVAGCPFTFEYPSYATISEKEETCWFDIYMSGFEARLHCSYVPVGSHDEYTDLVRDAFVIAYKINERANYMEESLIRSDHGAGGLSLQWTGPAASPVHFFMTDTTRHFFKAALYFDTQVRPDSLAPIVEFIQADIEHLISTFAWKPWMR